MMKMHIMNPRAVTAVKNPPCIESFASDVTTQIAAIKFKILEMTVKRPGVVFKYPKSNIFVSFLNDWVIWCWAQSLCRGRTD